MKRMFIAALATLALLAATSVAALAARARTWAELAPAPLASDSAFAALKARPADSLSVSELAWLAVQRDWRKERAREGERSSYYTGSLTAYPHSPRPNDARFAVLAAKPLADLSADERAWLVLENAAQQQEGRAGVGGGAVIGVVAVAALAAVAAVLFVSSHTIWFR